MSRLVRYHPQFSRDVIEASKWYDQRSEGLGNAFARNALDATMAVLANPDQFGRLDSGIRFNRLHRFPYIVLFEVTDEEVLLLGVLHSARSIEKWNRRQE